MRYENRLPPEGINTTQVHPLKQFGQLAIGSIVLVVILVMFLQFSGSFLARRIPFSFERAVMAQLDIPMGEPQKSPQMTAYLNSLAARVSAQLPMPEDMSVTVHYDSEEVFNAFATVGGNLLFYRGLLERMPDENTLAMVMAHEISHVLHRDPVASLGGGVVSAIALLGLTGNAGTGMAGQVLSNAGMLTSVQFTRKMEVAADKQALAGVNALYGHLNGASTLFELFSEARGESASKASPAWVERFFSTHPRDEDRTGSIARIAAENGWQTTGEVTPLPADFKLWLHSGGL
ncbi:M48 family metallopeptidase [Granulosicoccus antarcticus]|uniref:Beta-barrel assembly-enhancing protease n=1 Tax=Granulosicoccus antarcticus IMCC3135 TaxID=1192854 RepID=A0A2Z2NYL3_9GAMM|nr:M48 family metallopeptidase [Granulosicoccus antarcticus]ASJ76536.1 Beta-barrel assembly-enhancing protease [Granulosicoccus antarcticus IMCC3135]